MAEETTLNVSFEETPSQTPQVEVNSNIENLEGKDIETKVIDAENQPQTINIEDQPEDKVNIETEKKNENQSNEVGEDGYNTNEIYKFLSDNGIVQADENAQINSIDDIAKTIYQQNQEAIELGVKKELENYPESYKDLFEYVKNGGKVDEFVKSYQDGYSDIDITSLKNNSILQKKVMQDYYKATTQWSEQMIEKQMSKFDEDEISKFSRDALTTLKDIESNKRIEIKKQQDAQIKQQKEYEYKMIEEYRNKIEAMETIGDIHLSINDKKLIEDKLLTNKTVNKLTADFEKYRMNLAILDSYGLLDDINKLTEIVKDKTVKKKYNFKGKTNKNSQDNGSFDINVESNKPSGNQNVIPPFIF